MPETGDLHWTPSTEFAASTHLRAFERWLHAHHGLAFENYKALHAWSVADLDRFWRLLWDFFELPSPPAPGAALVDPKMPGAKWFPDVEVNYGRALLAPGEDSQVAVQHFSEAREPGALTWGQLRQQSHSVAATLQALSLNPGDRVAAYLPNIPEALVAMIATTGSGALWSSCSPDFGVASVLDRFRQIEPKVLIAVDGYRYGGRNFDRREAIQALVGALPSVQHIVYVPYLFPNEPAPSHINNIPVISWTSASTQRLVAGGDPFARDFPFDHPLWVVYSSGTTGLPKGMVHGHGGTLIEHLKAHSLHMNHGPESTLFFYTTTGWIMFNLLAAALLTGCSIVQYDGNPAYPDMKTLWRIAETAKVTSFGTSPTFVQTLTQHQVRPSDEFNLSALRGALCTGSPLTPESFAWFYENVKADLWVSSVSGGTDVATAFVGGAPTLPVHSGEIQALCLGVDVHAYDANGLSVTEEEGELVLTQPMPSMPLYFWNDPDGKRYHESYFDTYPGVWRHGDLMRITERGSSVISGRSDSTLNRHGIRIGTSEIYRAVEALEEIADSLVIHQQADDGDGRLTLFVVVDGENTLDDDLGARIRTHLRTERSPRHVPDDIVQIPMVPYTLTGKKMEVPVKKILQGIDPSKAANLDAMANPQALQAYVEYANSRSDSSA
jgi:acetoacetyl-CoA synthetase